jgi:hypothetical protein
MSVIRDEGLKDEEGALEAIDAAMTTLGAHPALVRQKAKVLGHYGHDDAAADLLITIEDAVGGASRALALRDGATSAARAGRYADAMRLYGKAAAAACENDGRAALCAGLRTEFAMAAWESGDRVAGLAALANVFDLLETIDHRASRQAERAHQFARGVGGLFAYDVGIMPGGPRPTIAFGGASALSTENEPLLNADVKPLADNWRVLALVERVAGFDLGIEARSLAKQKEPGVTPIELLFLGADNAHALAQEDLHKQLTSGFAFVSGMFVLQRVQAAGDGLASVDRASLPQTPAEDLLANPASREAIYRVIADILIKARLTGSWSVDFVDALHRACTSLLGEDQWLGPFFKAASGKYTPAANAPMPFWVARVAALSDEEMEVDPAARFQRDMLLVVQAELSPARRVLEPLIVNGMQADWRSVLDTQRFRLAAPGVHYPAIEAAWQRLAQTGLSAAAELLLSAAPAVRYDLTDNWQAALGRLVR